MDNKVNITTLWIAILMLFCVTLSAQNEIQSPYSNFGIGVPTNRTNGASAFRTYRQEPCGYSPAG